MEKETGVSEDLLELRQVAEACGPRSTKPPHVRLPFPQVALPRVLRQFVSEVSDSLGVAPECVATPAIATCASAIGNTCRIRPKPNWEEPAVIWAVTLMESGSLKTPAYKEAFKPLQVAQDFKEAEFKQRQMEYLQAKAQYEGDARLWQQGQEGLQEPPGEPEKPEPKDVFTSNFTAEAVAKLLENNPRGLALTRDELSAFFGSFGAYKGGRGGDEAMYLEAYSAGPVKVDRACSKRIYARSAVLSIFGTCQPAVFANLIGMTGHGPNQVENGMASRFLIAAPAPKPKRWREAKPYDVQPYRQMVETLFAFPLKCDAEGKVDPITVDLLPEARERFVEFYNEQGAYEATIANAPTRYHYAKMPGIAARLALIFYLCDLATHEARGPEVQERHVLAGIALARWYGREAWRFYNGLETEDQRVQRELVAQVDAHGSITLREMGNIRGRWRDRVVAERAMRLAAQTGGLEVVLDPPGPNGGGRHLRLQRIKDPVMSATPENPEIPEVALPAGE